MQVEFKNSLDGEARAIFNFFRDENSRKNWFWIPNISANLIEKIKKSNALTDEMELEIKDEIQHLYLKFKPLIDEQMRKIQKEWNKENFFENSNKQIVCWLCLFLPGGLFNYKNKSEVFAGLFRPTKKLIHVIKHEILHIEFWDETKDMNYKNREHFIEEKMKLLLSESQ